MKIAMTSLCFAACLVVLLNNCGVKKQSAKSTDTVKEKISDIKMISYAKEVAPLLTLKCTPCHFPPKGGVLPLNNHEALSKHIKSVIRRVSLPTSDPAFMPMKNPDLKLTDGEIALLKNWESQGFGK